MNNNKKEINTRYFFMGAFLLGSVQTLPGGRHNATKYLSYPIKTTHAGILPRLSKDSTDNEASTPKVQHLIYSASPARLELEVNFNLIYEQLLH